MAHNRFIRPVNKNYHDFTQQKIDESIQDVPLKFKQHYVQDYVPKPPKKPVEPEPRVVPIIQIHHQPEPGCCSNFSCCNAQVCGQCANKICHQCKTGCCTKFTICQDCKNKLCEMCKQRLFGFSKKFQLRSYPIRKKHLNQYHFKECQCPRCLKLE